MNGWMPYYSMGYGWPVGYPGQLVFGQEQHRIPLPGEGTMMDDPDVAIGDSLLARLLALVAVARGQHPATSVGCPPSIGRSAGSARPMGGGAPLPVPAFHPGPSPHGGMYNLPPPAPHPYFGPGGHAPATTHFTRPHLPTRPASSPMHPGHAPRVHPHFLRQWSLSWTGEPFFYYGCWWVLTPAGWVCYLDYPTYF